MKRKPRFYDSESDASSSFLMAPVKHPAMRWDVMQGTFDLCNREIQRSCWLGGLPFTSLGESLGQFKSVSGVSGSDGGNVFWDSDEEELFVSLWEGVQPLVRFPKQLSESTLADPLWDEVRQTAARLLARLTYNNALGSTPWPTERNPVLDRAYAYVLEGRAWGYYAPLLRNGYGRELVDELLQLDVHWFWTSTEVVVSNYPPGQPKQTNYHRLREGEEQSLFAALRCNPAPSNWLGPSMHLFGYSPSKAFDPSRLSADLLALQGYEVSPLAIYVAQLSTGNASFVFLSEHFEEAMRGTIERFSSSVSECEHRPDALRLDLVAPAYAHLT